MGDGGIWREARHDRRIRLGWAEQGREKLQLSGRRIPERKKRDREGRAAEPWSGRQRKSREERPREKQGEGEECDQWILSRSENSMVSLLNK
jgi:hypothetical protein